MTHVGRKEDYSGKKTLQFFFPVDAFNASEPLDPLCGARFVRRQQPTRPAQLIFSALPFKPIAHGVQEAANLRFRP